MQNTRYVVVSGARQKDEEWDPEENGGYAVHGTFLFRFLRRAQRTERRTQKPTQTRSPSTLSRPWRSQPMRRTT